MASPTILIADDDSHTLPTLALHLRNEGYEVMCAESGGEALEMARRSRPDLIVADAYLGVREGVTLRDRLAQIPDFDTMPIIFLIPERSEQQRRVHAELDREVVIAKPVATRELLDKVRTMLDEGDASTAEQHERVA